MRYLKITEILDVAERHVKNYQIMNESHLNYLVEVVKAKFDNIDYYPTLFQKAAAYAYNIIAGHVFLDGNKRIGMNCAILFLELNGCTINLDIDDSIIDLGLSIASGEIDDIDLIAQQLQSWVL